MARHSLVFRVFLSSTFRDLIAERNALHEKTFPQLRRYCEMRGARFLAIDLRWGVSEEAALNQQTITICLDEIARCREVSPKPNFIVLLGNRYGWRPLPTQIPTDEFEALVANVPRSQRSLLVAREPVPAWQGGTTAIRLGWYRQDLNAVPTQYVLQPRIIDLAKNITDEDKKRILRQEAEDWRKCEATMHIIISDSMNELGWAKGDPRRKRYEHSATHQEIEFGALHPSLDSEKHVFAYFREITGAPKDESAAAFIDANAAGESLVALKQQLEQRLPKEHIFRYEAQWQSDHPESDLDWLCQRVFDNLRSIIDAELGDFQQRSELEREKEDHREFAQDRCRHFIGRQGLLKQITDYLEDPHDNYPLILHGASGCGKTALMAHAWLTLTNPEQAISRFIGATPGSADLRTLLRSVCEQLGIQSPPTDMNDLIRTFQERLAGTPAGKAIVFFDALDQLTPGDNARMLYWLPRTLAPGVKLILSVSGTAATRMQVPACDEPFDIARRIWPDRLLEVESLSPQEGQFLLQTWLNEDGRTLQEQQKLDILKKFTQNGNPFYLKVSFEEARRWHSWEGLPRGADAVPGLSDTTQGILTDMLYRLEGPRHHGRILVERALGSIAAAKNGLTEDELLDILSADTIVVDDFFSRNPESPSIDRLPVIIWSGLNAELKPFMTQRRADGTVVMNFYHRQVAEAVKTRYLSNVGDCLRAHVRLGDYFNNLDYWAESLEDQRQRVRRLPPTPRPANVRKVVELPYHHLEAARLGGSDDPNSPYWDMLVDLLTDWQFLEAKAEADPNYREQETRA